MFSCISSRSRRNSSFKSSSYENSKIPIQVRHFFLLFTSDFAATSIDHTFLIIFVLAAASSLRSLKRSFKSIFSALEDESKTLEGTVPRSVTFSFYFLPPSL